MKRFLVFAFVLASTLAFAAGEPPLVVKSGQTQQLPAADTLQLRNVTGSTQCIHADASGNLTGTGSDCGSGAASGANPTATAGDVAVNGSASTFLRSDGAPAVQKGSPSQFGIVKVDNTTITASGGILSLPGIADASLLSNITGGSAVPAANGVSAVLDHAFGSTQGDILYRGASGWQVLAPGSQYSLLQSGGSGGNPSWTVGVAPLSVWRFIVPVTTSFTNSFAAHGDVYTPLQPINIYSVAAILTTVTSATYKVCAGLYNTGTNKLSATPVCSSSYAVVTGSANQEIAGNLSTPLSVAAGQTFAVYFVRTDSTATVSMTVNNTNTAPANENQPGFATQTSPGSFLLDLASVNPGTGDAWTVSTGTWHGLDFLYALQ